MTCAKQRVKAVLVATNGRTFIGENLCANPQSVCPRDAQGFKSGEGYHLCKDVCEQGGHAEEQAIALAGELAIGSTLTVLGHTYACDNCKQIAAAAGVVRVEVLP